MALYHCHNTVIAFRQLLSELTMFDDIIADTTDLYGDNKQANKIVEDDLITSGNQYIYMTYHALKEAHAMDIIRVFHKRTKLNLADILTKNCDANTIRNLNDQLCGYKLELIKPDHPHREF